MDGDTALWYVRSRYTTSDFDRTRRQQEVIRALFLRLLSLNAIERAPELYNIYRQNVTTDLSLGDITPLLPLAVHLKNLSNIHQYYIGPAEVTPWTTPAGAQVLLPRTYAILALLQKALGPH
jgi:anionic cell wall polymer biosynthesis LytR-Cps2A-Psr (LCP) family protein